MGTKKLAVMMAILGVITAVSIYGAAWAEVDEEPGMESTGVVEGAAQTMAKLVGGIGQASLAWYEIPKNALGPAGAEQGVSDFCDETGKGIMNVATFPYFPNGATSTPDGRHTSQNQPGFSALNQGYGLDPA